MSSKDDTNRLRRLLDRVGYGARPGEGQHAQALGFEAYLEEQLTPEGIEDEVAERWIAGRPLYHLDLTAMIQHTPAEVAQDLIHTTLLRAIYSRRQVYEALVMFWADHFNIYLRKTQFVPYLKVLDDRQVIRPHALGSFRDLLLASMRSPAMLVYLDNIHNRRDAPNENYARELLELHTLGLTGGYTQGDIDETARILTGHTIVRDRRRPGWGERLFRPGWHDGGPKRVLGQRFPGRQGEGEAWALAEMLARHPATAHFISRKLARRFVADDPPAALVQEMAQSFQASAGDIRQTVRTMFLSPAFATAPPKLRRPLAYLLSAVRYLGAQVAVENDLPRWLERLGQPLFQWPAPDGYPESASSWSNKLLPRWNFALGLTTGRVAGVQVPWEMWQPAGRTLSQAVEQLARHVLHQGSTPGAQDALRRFLMTDGGEDDRARLQQAAALLLAGPAFQWM